VLTFTLQRTCVQPTCPVTCPSLHTLSQGLASVVGPATNWRLPFVLVAIPAVLLALLMVLTTSDPPRGAFEVALQAGMGEGLSYEEVISWQKTRVLLKQTTNWLIIVQVSCALLSAHLLIWLGAGACATKDRQSFKGSHDSVTLDANNAVLCWYAAASTCMVPST
jgi:hypothetical protein